MSIPIEKTIPITQASRNLAGIIKKLPHEKYFFIVKNYKPVAKISAVGEEGDEFPIESFDEIRERAWGGRTRVIQEAFERLVKLPARELPLLLRDRKGRKKYAAH